MNIAAQFLGHCRFWLSASVILLVVGCSPSDAPLPPEPEVEVIPPLGTTQLQLSFKPTKLLQFNWEAAEHAEFYRLWENPDGLSGFSQISSDLAAQSTGFQLRVPLYTRLRASYLLEACRGDQCVAADQVSVGKSLAQSVGYLKADAPVKDGHFGMATALSHDGRYLAIGAITEEDGPGLVYVYERNAEDDWVLQAKLMANFPSSSDFFGQSLSFSDDGQLLAVGAPGPQLNDEPQRVAAKNASSVGAAYLFVRTDGHWYRQGQLSPSDSLGDDNYGSAVSLSGDGKTLAVAAERADVEVPDGVIDQAGVVYLYRRIDGVWIEQTLLRSKTPTMDEFFGAVVALDQQGQQLVIGVPNAEVTDDSGAASGSGAGRVDIFEQGLLGWGATAPVQITAAEPKGGRYFGSVLGLSRDGKSLAIGAPNESVQQSGQELYNSGAVYIYTKVDTEWQPVTKLQATRIEKDTYFGAALGLSADGKVLAIGTAGDGTAAQGLLAAQPDTGQAESLASGAVYLFRFSQSEWQPSSYLKANNSGDGDRFGEVLSLSGDGETLAVAATLEDGEAGGINPVISEDILDIFNAGAVYLY